MELPDVPTTVANKNGRIKQTGNNFVRSSRSRSRAERLIPGDTAGTCVSIRGFEPAGRRTGKPLKAFALRDGYYISAPYEITGSWNYSVCPST